MDLKDGRKDTENLTQVLEVINAKGDTGEIEEILNSTETDRIRTKPEGNDVVII